ncbi:MAG: Omp28-related outer membrane protein [Ignavibacteria bacterium]
MKFKIFTVIITLLISVSILSVKDTNSEPRRVILEFCTGTWCPWCPCGDYTATNICHAHPLTIVLAYHGPYLYGGDPFTNFNGYSIITSLGFTAYPTAIIDRTNSSTNFDYTMWTSAVNSRYSSSPNSVVSIVLTAKNYNSSTRVLTATVNSTALQTLSDQYKINYIITENHIIYDPQSNNGQCVPASSNYMHEWVVRNMVNGPTGDNLNSGTWAQNQTIATTINTTLDNAWNAANCDLVIFAYKSTSPMYMSEMGQGFLQAATTPLGVQTSNEIPASFSLSQNYPNPFNPTTNIKFSLAKDGNASLKIYDMIGNEVATYYNGFLKAGYYNAEVDASNWASGVYFYKLTAGSFIETKKMMLIK